MKLVGVFSYRYDEELVPDLMENIAFCDEIISIDDRDRKEKWFHEGTMFAKQRELAEKSGADWILFMSPDERLEKNAGNIIRRLIQNKQKVVYYFNFKELFDPTKYRVDGIWGHKKRECLWPVYPNQIFMNTYMQCQLTPQNKEYERIHTGLNIYHMKHIKPENSKRRSDFFKSQDPKNEFQTIGYDYLKDEKNKRLEEIPLNRLYDPPYKDYYKLYQVI